MSGHEALQSEHLVDGNGNTLTTDATVEGIIRLLQQVQPKTDAPKRKASTRVSSRLSKRQKTAYTRNSTGAQPLHSQATRSRKRHDAQPMNSDGTNIEMAAHGNERQRTAHGVAVGTTGTTAKHGNAPASNNEDDASEDAHAVAHVHYNNHTSVAAGADNQLNTHEVDAMNCSNCADAHDTAARSIPASDGFSTPIGKKRRQHQQHHEEAEHQDDAPTQTIHSELDTDHKELVHAVRSQNSNKILHQFKKHLGQKESFETIRQLVHHSGVVTSDAPSTTELQAQCKRLRDEKDSWKADAQAKKQQFQTHGALCCSTNASSK